MLKLTNIVKDYEMGGTKTRALAGVDIEFRQNEFVAVLGPSGCGKTTLLNIIGGLDRYSEGDLIINDVSTRDFTSADWDTYRNHSVGFVFQSYNLIPHQSVLANVELALTLTGVPKAERLRRATAVLERVGLGEHLRKKPNQLSGGQMQRVAIARALVNDPDIILADEPTGALDSETSVQVMDVLREISGEKLIIMVTHNPELAEQYADRIVRLKDGRVVDDSNPCTLNTVRPLAQGHKQPRKPSMNFLTALSLSTNNLLTKKARTILTAFAGSIGIIGIAAILALSTGINRYIDKVQEDTLASYPITIQGESMDMTAMLTNLMAGQQADETESEAREEDRVYASAVMYEMMDSMLNAETVTNNLTDFKTFLDAGGNGISDLANIRYGYEFRFDVYNRDVDGAVVKSDVISLMQTAMSTMYGGDYTSFFEQMGDMYQAMDVWQELLPGEDGALISPQVTEQYDLLYGAWPQSEDEVILFVDGNNEVSDLMLYALGLISQAEMNEALLAMQSGEAAELTDTLSWSYEELCDASFKLILPTEYWQYDSTSGSYIDLSAAETGLELLVSSADVGIPLKVSGVARTNSDAMSGMLSGSIGYTSALTTRAIEETAASDIVQAQMSDPDTDVLTGLPFATGLETEPAAAEKAAAISEYLLTLPTAEQADIYVALLSRPEDGYVQQLVEQELGDLSRGEIETMIAQQYAEEMGVDAQTLLSYVAQMSDEELFAQVEAAAAEQIRTQYAAGVQQQLAARSETELASMLQLLVKDDPALATMGVQPLTEAQQVWLYDTYMPPTLSDSSYEARLDALGYVDLEKPDIIRFYTSSFADKDTVTDLIAGYNQSVDEADEISYTDYVGLLMSSVTTIVNAISYVLIAFVSISLIVSSIMIGIITYISVLERTKEIGILRAMGASKRDISRVFNAETIIVGLVAGALGIGITLLLCLPSGALLRSAAGIDAAAYLPPVAAVVLVLISVVLTFIAGLIPARLAAKKDPVVALRTE